MVNLIWVFLSAVGILVAAFNGRMQEVNEAVFQSLETGVEIAIQLLGILMFWLGMMKIAEKSGLIEKVSDVFTPFVTRIFPDIPKDHKVTGYIVSNMTANIFGLGNAATPLGIKAMKELQTLSGDKERATRPMITLLALNTSSLTLIPTTVIAIRMKYDSTDPTSIIPATIMATAISTIAALLIDRWLNYRKSVDSL
ncbi:nucleoside recognition domain-containing protein [Salimicrobium halophilum]|uniref:Spore maturation protein A n=1 Tax=Salimicrobium halophilum TaxID=86666 RepID=A0A1G8PYB8_9BACI|nr:nucleoside recognition domain-containing protein [Salimicrobium halophilum]SDI97368.1 spore maturation protein A [Salimicrobium halophilum]